MESNGHKRGIQKDCVVNQNGSMNTSTADEEFDPWTAWAYKPRTITLLLIGEIENRSAHLLAIKTDVETLLDFIRFLIKEVENVAFTNIEDVVPFVKWLDDELFYLVDERAVLKHFDWPERKTDILREAAFGFCDLKNLLSDVLSFRDDDHRQPCTSSLKKMQALFKKLEHGIYSLSRLREYAMNRFKGFHIPMAWMLDTGPVITQMPRTSGITVPGEGSCLFRKEGLL